MKYKAKVGFIQKFVVFTTLIVVGVALIYAYMMTQELSILFVVIEGIISAGFIHIIFDSSYTLKDDHIHAKLGWISVKIKYSNIKNIRKERRFYNKSLALSLDAVVLDLHKTYNFRKFVAISPQNRDEFIADLSSRCHQLDSKKNEEFDF